MLGSCILKLWHICPPQSLSQNRAASLFGLSSGCRQWDAEADSSSSNKGGVDGSGLEMSGTAGSYCDSAQPLVLFFQVFFILFMQCEMLWTGRNTNWPFYWVHLAIRYTEHLLKWLLSVHTCTHRVPCVLKPCSADLRLSTPAPPSLYLCVLREEKRVKGEWERKNPWPANLAPTAVPHSKSL